MAQTQETALSTLTAARAELDVLKAEAALGPWSPFSLAAPRDDGNTGTQQADALTLLVTLLPGPAASLLTVMCHHVVVDEVLHVLSLAAHEAEAGRPVAPRALRLAEVILQQASPAHAEFTTPRGI